MICFWIGNRQSNPIGSSEYILPIRRGKCWAEILSLSLPAMLNHWLGPLQKKVAWTWMLNVAVVVSSIPEVHTLYSRQQSLSSRKTWAVYSIAAKLLNREEGNPLLIWGAKWISRERSGIRQIWVQILLAYGIVAPLHQICCLMSEYYFPYL